MNPSRVLGWKSKAAFHFAVLALATRGPAAPTAITASAFTGWTANNATTASLPFTYVPGPDGILVAWVTGEGTFGAAQAATFLWDDGDTQAPLTLGARRASGGSSGLGGAFVQIYYLLSPPNGNGIVRVTLNGPGTSVQRSVLGALYATNARGWEASATAASSGAQTLTAGPLAVSAGALVVDIAAHSRAPFDAVGSGIVEGGDTLLYAQPAGPVTSGSGASYLASAAAGSYSARWHIGSDDAAEHEAVLMASFAASSGADIRAFAVNDPFVYGTPVIDQTAGTITITVLPGVDLANLAPTLLLSDGATCVPASGSVQNFNNPVNYTVTSGDNAVTRVYTVTPVSPPGLGIWNNPLGGDWETTANWLNETPPLGQGALGYFPSFSPPSGPITVANAGLGCCTAADRYMKGIIINSPDSYTFSGSIWTKENFEFKVLQGTHVSNIGFEGTDNIETPVILDVAGGARLTFANALYEYTAYRLWMEKKGPGTAALTFDYGTAPGPGGENWFYKRDTLVNAGLLLANAPVDSVSRKSTVVVNNGGTLGGTGGVGSSPVGTLPLQGGTVRVHSGGTIAPGDPAVNGGTGTLTLNYGLTLHHGSNLTFQLGATSDLLRITAGTFTGSASAGGVTVFLSDIGALPGENTYDLINFNGATATGVDASDFLLAPGPFAGGTFSINANKLRVTVNGPPFQITGIVRDPATGYVTLTFLSVAGAIYAVEASTDLVIWEEIEDSLAGQPGETPYEDSTYAPTTGDRRAFYRVKRLP